MLGNALLNY